MKKWWIGALVFLLALVASFVWGSMRTPRSIQVVTYGGFEVYDVEYFPSTNGVHYWRAAWRDGLCLVGLKPERARAQAIQHGPALVVYHSIPSLSQCYVWAHTHSGHKHHGGLKLVR